jgi:transcription factor WhiB
MLPAWTADAACKKRRGAGTLDDRFFHDDVAWPEDTDIDNYPWPAVVVEAMRKCGTCPVRAKCLEYAFQEEMTEPERWWTSKRVEAKRRFGVFGGVPGRIREQLGTQACSVCEGSGFTEGFGPHKALGEWLYPDKPGFLCPACLGEGREARPGRLVACEDWFRNLAAKRHWTVAEGSNSRARSA